VLNDVGLIGSTALDNSIIARVTENARNDVLIRIIVGKTDRTLIFLLPPPVVNDTP